MKGTACQAITCRDTVTPEESSFSDAPSETEEIDTSTWHSAYKKLLPSKSIAFLYSDTYNTALREDAQILSIRYDVTAEQALEEFRRFIALKVHLKDGNATLLSPTPLSKYRCF